VHHFLEDDGVNVLAQHVEQEPISHFGLLDDNVDAFFLDEAKADVEQIGPHSGRENDEDAVNDDQEGKRQKEQQPEPQEDVNLLVDNVQRQDAHGVVLFNLAGSSEFVKRTFGHPGKDVHHWIDTILLITLGKGDHLDAKSKKGAVKEPIHQEHLAEDIEQCKELAEKVSVSPKVMIFQIGVEIVEEELLFLPFLSFRDDAQVQIHFES